MPGMSEEGDQVLKAKVRYSKDHKQAKLSSASLPFQVG